MCLRTGFRNAIAKLNYIRSENTRRALCIEIYWNGQYKELRNSTRLIILNNISGLSLLYTIKKNDVSVGILRICEKNMCITKNSARE